MAAKPTLSDLPMSRRALPPGAKVLASVTVEIDAAQAEKIKKSVDKFFTTSVNLMVVNRAYTEIYVTCVMEGRECRNMLVQRECQGLYVPGGVQVSNTMKLSCEPVEFHSGDILVVSDLRFELMPQLKKDMHRMCKQWAGDGVEVVLLNK